MLQTRVLVGFYAVGMLFALANSAAAVEWTGDYSKALKSAARTGRPLLIVFERPSTAESRITPFSGKSNSTSSVLLEGFELCRIDVATKSGRQIAEAFRATAFPYVAVTDRYARRIVYRKVGQFSDRDWVVMLARYGEPLRRPTAYVPNRPTSGFGRRCFT